MKSANDFKVAFETEMVKYSWWSRLAGSQFVEMIATFIGQMVLKAQLASSRYLQEAFLSTAVKRASILAAAEDRGYIGRKSSPSKGFVAITNKTSNVVSIPNHTPLVSAASISYVTIGAVNLAPAQVAQVAISQLVLQRFSVTVDSASKFMEVILPKDVSAKTHKIDVRVTSQSGASALWEKRYMFRRTSSTSKVYTEFYRPTEQIGIRFGNGVNGMIPPAGSVVTLDVWTTSGVTTLLDGQELEITGDKANLNSVVSIVTQTSITGGAPAESDEETRAGALYVTPFDNQIAWEDDYSHFIRTNISGITWVNAWGEQEQEKQDSASSLNNINKIFIAAYSKDKSQLTLESEIISLLENTSYLNKRYQYVALNEVPFTIQVTGTATGDKDLVSIITQTKLTLSKIFGKDPDNSRLERILEKEVNKAIRDLDLFYDFSVSWTGYPLTERLEDYIYLDTSNSVFNITYLAE